MPRLGDEPVASGSASGGLGAGIRTPKRSNSGHSHGKGKKRVSDEGMYEEEGLLSGLRGRNLDEGEDLGSVCVQHQYSLGANQQQFDAAIATPGEASTSKTRDKSRTIPLRPTGQSPVLKRTDDPGRKSPYPPNVVRNQKYSIATFFPLTFYEQFKFFFNFYFLVVALSQFIPALKIGKSCV
jgi:phospholipid-translocating ATPase